MRPPAMPLLLGAMGRVSAAVPSVPDAYTRQEIGIVAGLLMLLAQDYDRGAARRVDEIEALSRLVRRGAELRGGPSLGSALEESSKLEGNLSMSALDRRLDILRGAIIDLHEWLEDEETDETAEAQALLGDVWAELRAGIARRAMDLPIGG